MSLEGLPLAVATAPGWAAVALKDVNALLLDHAHCEHKAASMALRLISRFPHHQALVRPLLGVAAEEMNHFRQVLDLLDDRGVAFNRPAPDRYVNILRRRCSSEGHGLGGPSDPLLAAAFVEARSCERFRLLAHELGTGSHPDEAELGRFYARLAEAECRHWCTFRDLAASGTTAARLERRLKEVASMEAEIISSLPHQSRMH